MFIVVLVGIFKRKYGFGVGLRTSIKALAITWGVFAILRAVFVFVKFGDQALVTPTFHLVPEPMDAKFFLMVGLLLLPLVFAIVLEERRKRFVVKSIEDMQSLSASEFENLVADSYREQGHQVDVVGSSGDHGIDLIVHTRKGETWLVQCKKYRGKVGEPVIRDFYGALRASEASAGAIVTTGQITEQARLWAEGKPIHLYDGLEFWKVIESTRLRKSLPVEATRNLKTANAPVPAFRNVMRPAMESIYATSSTGENSQKSLIPTWAFCRIKPPSWIYQVLRIVRSAECRW